MMRLCPKRLNLGSEMVIFKRSLPSKLGIPHESTSLWHVQTTKDHSHTPRYTRDMISYPLYFFRLIDRGLKSASGSASRLPAAVTAAPMALGMPPEHQLSGPSQPGAAQEPPGAPTGRHRAHPCQARPGAISAGLQESTKVARRAAGEAAAGGGDGRGGGLGDGGGGGGVGGGGGAVRGTCGAHSGCCQGAVRVARGRLRAGRASKAGLGGRRRTVELAKSVVLTPGCRPQTQTPLPEPWLHHNHGPGGPPDSCSYGRRPAPYERGGQRPLGTGMGCGAGAHRLGVEGGVEGVLSTVSDDSSTTNSAPARRMSQVSERVRLWRPKEGEGLDALLTAHVGWADVKGLRIVVGWAQFGSSCLRQGRAGKWPFRMQAGGRRTGSWSNAHDKPRCGSRSRCQRKWGSSTSGALESPVGSARAHGRIAFGQESPPWSCP